MHSAAEVLSKHWQETPIVIKALLDDMCEKINADDWDNLEKDKIKMLINSLERAIKNTELRINFFKTLEQIAKVVDDRGMGAQYEASIARLHIDEKFMKEMLSQQKARFEQANKPAPGFAYWTEVIILLLALVILLSFIIMLFCCCQRKRDKSIMEGLLKET